MENGFSGAGKIEINLVRSETKFKIGVKCQRIKKYRISFVMFSPAIAYLSTLPR